MLIDTELVITRELRHAQVMSMDVLATRDLFPRHADDLVVSLHRFAGGDVARCNFMARRDEPGNHKIF